ncbi:hypothetical protein C8F04DRAFT_1192370 [Mycena alexandri]|uniref:YDG domain-containing protein n=1 Tax=Mycena alexandri TaxID=1745969 RepID=A0AAD6SBH7_9AGAR|nr:hypothetical protein C8F04DRAFT_1192370 [Mycena alexandri]
MSNVYTSEEAANEPIDKTSLSRRMTVQVMEEEDQLRSDQDHCKIEVGFWTILPQNDGLYAVTEAWEDKGRSRFKVYKFRFVYSLHLHPASIWTAAPPMQKRLGALAREAEEDDSHEVNLAQILSRTLVAYAAHAAQMSTHP